MDQHLNRQNSCLHNAGQGPGATGCHAHQACGFSRRHFMGILGGAAAWGGLACLAPGQALAEAVAIPGSPLPPGKPLRVQPVLTYHLDQPRERTSWRSYGGLRTQADVEREVRRLEGEIKELAAQAGFPLEFLPLARVNKTEDAKTASQAETDAFLVFGASGSQQWLEMLAATKKPNILFVRHQSGPVYLWYEIAHWRLLRKSEDTQAEPNLDFEDVVVDDFEDVRWRLRGLYGLKNARGTVMLAIGGLVAYSKPGQELGPGHAQNAWGCRIQKVDYETLKDRLQKARADARVQQAAETATDELLRQPNVALQTGRKYVVNTFLTLRVIKDLMAEHQASNVGVADCMGGLIPIFDTPPCLALSVLNDEGFTAFCHTDLTHTMPGVLLRWISNKPSFVCNSHFPHHGLITLAHCAAPRKMNGRDFEPTTLMTHYESDYGAATKVHYPKGQVITCLVPNLRCTKWFAFRGKIVNSPAMDMCRSQMDVQIDGDWRALAREMEGFHAIVCYGDYLRETGYAVKKSGAVEWRNYSELS